MQAIFAACLIAFMTGAAAQSITVAPSPAYEGQIVGMGAPIPGNSCTHVAAIEAVELDGLRVSIVYSLRPESHGCFLPTPMGIGAVLGRFPPGQYELAILRLENGYRVGYGLTTFEVVPKPATPPFAKLEILGGDRQIVFGIGPKPLGEDVVVRATDDADRPVAGTPLLVDSPGRYGTAVNVDEFGAGAFGAWSQLWMRTTPWKPEPVVITDGDGIARASVSPNPGFPASFVVGAGAAPNAGSATQAFANGVWLAGPPEGSPVVAVEFHHASLGRYFVAVRDDEVAALDRGAFAGWKRSVGAMAVWPTRESAPAEAVPVCRFYSAVHTAHFLTIDPVECNQLAERWPGVWMLESREAFWVIPPDPRTAFCPAGTQPVYRMYRAIPGPAHRYVTGARLRDTMVRAGWIHEGPTADRGAMCVPA